MFKKLLTLSILLLAVLNLRAADLPKASSGDDVTWYLIQFLNGDGVLTAQEDGANVKTAVATGKASQFWKLEGSNTDGYKLTSKNGMVLYTTTTAKSGMFQSAAAPSSSNTLFVIQTTTNTTYSDGFVISPKANKSVYMNQWGGSGTGVTLGLWDNRADANQPLKFVSAEEWSTTGSPLTIIPYPQSLTQTDARLAVSQLTGIQYVDEPTQRYAEEFAAQLKKVAGISLTASASAPSQGIAMTVNTALEHEAYTLTIDAQGVAITAADSTGFFYALQTIKQLLPSSIYGDEPDTKSDWTLPGLTITDKPNLGHRGFMLDVARHFFSKQEVERILNVMASYKMNRFHWHLTDDQGWRVEIPEYPLLTTVGSKRAGSFVNAGGSSNFFDDTEYGEGYWFSLDDLREIVKYAKDRNIEIIPEIDLPGHMVAAVAAYPELSCDPTKSYEVRISGGISQDVLNIGKDETIDFLKCVLGHVAEIFPYQYIHLGGDECPTTQWANNADCLKRVSDEGLSGVNELQSWLVEQLGTWLKDKYGKDIVVWDELLAHWSENNTVKPVIMAWNSIGKSSDAADKGFKSIIVPYQTLYLDFMQVATAQRDVCEGYQGGWGDGWVNSVDEIYNFNPLSSLSGREDYALGVQGNMWTETCNDSLELEYQLFPRLLAIAETGWLPTSLKNWTSFYQRLQLQRSVLDTFGMNYAKHFFEDEELTAGEEAITLAENILSLSHPGAVGYPSKENYEALEAALTAYKANTSNADALTTLTQAITLYQTADITQPTAGKYYQVISASRYYKAKYAGSTAYANGSNIKFHYTPQVEPQELWQFTPSGTTYTMTSALNSLQVSFPSANGSNLSLSENGTAVKIVAATTASGEYTYIPGVVNIAAASTYGTGTAQFFWGDCTGFVQSNAQDALCYPGTWYIEEVTDFTAWLRGLVNKATKEYNSAAPGEIGEPSQEAVDFLLNKVITPATAAVEAGNVSEATYKEYMALYEEYLEFPMPSAIDALSEEYYYNIRNTYFTSYYAAGTTSNTVAPRTMSSNTDAYKWAVKKNSDNTITLTNKLTDTAAYPASDAANANIQLGKSYNWSIDEFTTDEGNSGLRIKSESDAYSWYTNPSAWSNNVILKPSTWGAGVWEFIKTTDTVTGIRPITANSDVTTYYDLQGRRVAYPIKGIYVTNHGKKVIR